MTGHRSRWPALVAIAVLTLLGGCGGAGPAEDDRTPAPSPTSAPPPAAGGPTPTTEPGGKERRATEPAETPPSGLVYYAGRRARTGELLLFAEQSAFTGRKDLLAGVRAATAGPPVDPDYTSLWRGDVVDSVRLWWDGDEGYYDVRLRDPRAVRRPPGTSMREAHLAIQQVVWTLHSVGGIRAPVRFHLDRSGEPVTNLLGVPATGAHDTYPAADHSGVLSSINILTPADGSTVDEVDRVVEVRGLAESFEATVAVRVLGPTGEIVVDDSTMAQECCGRLFPWRYSLDTSGWAPGDYVLVCTTDDPVGIEGGSDGPEIDTRTIRIR